MPDEKDREQLRDTFKKMNIDYAKTLTIGEGINRRIIIKPVVKYKEKYDYASKIPLASYYYHNGDYKSSLKINLELMKVFSSPRYYIFARIGLTYYKLGDLEKAIKYLTIAQDTRMYDKSKKTKDYENLIKHFQDILKKQQQTKEPNLKIKDFNKQNEFYGIEDIKQIAKAIHDSKGNIEKACTNFNLTIEQIQLIKLICVRIYYSEENYNYGNKVLLEVEKTKNKTQLIKKVINETKQNKLFYKNRQTEEEKELGKILHPKISY